MLNSYFLNNDDVDVPLVDVSVLKKLIAGSKPKKKVKAKMDRSALKKIFSQILSEMNVEPSKKVKKSSKLSKRDMFDNILQSIASNTLVSPEIDEVEEDDDQYTVKIPKKKIAVNSKEETIKIASKEIKDSHYQIDLAKDVVSKNGKKMIMVSAYFRDAYLGRYLIKRNFYYLMNNDEAANETFAELNKKMRMIKSNYYDGRSTIKSIATDVHKVLQGVIADFRFEEEDELGTTVKRN